MKAPGLDTLPDQDLVASFAAAAREMGLAVLESETRRANKMYDRMTAIDAVLRSRGRAARMALVPLLDQDDRLIRYYAAKKLLGLVPERARAEIEWNAKYRFDAIAGDAKGLLRAFDSGQYAPD